MLLLLPAVLSAQAYDTAAFDDSNAFDMTSFDFGAISVSGKSGNSSGLSIEGVSIGL